MEVLETMKGLFQIISIYGFDKVLGLYLLYLLGKKFLESNDIWISRGGIVIIIALIITYFYLSSEKKGSSRKTDKSSVVKPIEEKKELLKKNDVISKVIEVEEENESLKKVDIHPTTKLIEDEKEVEDISYEEKKIEEDVGLSQEEIVLEFIDNMNQRTEEGYNNSYSDVTINQE